MFSCRAFRAGWMSWFHEGLAEDERMDAYLRGDPRFQCRMSTEWGRRWTAAIRIRVPVRILHQLPPWNEGRLTRLHLHVEPISRSTTRRRHGAADRQSGGGGGLLKSRVAACHHRHGYDASAAVIHSFIHSQICLHRGMEVTRVKKPSSSSSSSRNSRKDVSINQSVINK